LTVAEPVTLGARSAQWMVSGPAGVLAGICMRISKRIVRVAAIAPTGAQFSA